uniref:Lipoprotein n=1 Tax=Caenorhabditis tropicalis TaxID=1561998 RepID=A0A1I7TNR1_9PELO
MAGCSKKEPTTAYEETTATTTTGTGKPNSKSMMDKLRKEDSKDGKKKGEAEYENCGDMMKNGQLEKMKEAKTAPQESPKE